MSASEPNFDGLMEIDRDDILAAMQKLTKMIQSDKQFDISEIQQPKQHFASSPHINSASSQKPQYPSYTQQNNTYHHDHYDNNDLVEGLKSVAYELSQYDDNLQVLNESVSPSGIPSGRHQMTDKSSKYTTAEKSHKTDRYTNTVNRLHELDNKKREKIAAKQFQQYKQELSALRSKPQISLNSRIIAEQKRSVPIYERTQMIMKQKEENINKLRRELEARREDRDLSPTFQPDLSFTKRYNYEKQRTLKEFTSQMYAWQHRKNEALQKEQYENIARELSELTFKPKINNKSRSIAQKVNQNVPVENRLQKHKDQIEEKRKERLEKDKPAFKPILNERSMNLANSKKNLTRKSYRHDRSANLSYTDISRDEGRSRSPNTHSRSPAPHSRSPGPVTQSRSPVANKKTPVNHGRSVTPTKVTSKTMYRDRSPEFHQVSPKFNEVNYSPAVDFLLRKLGK